VARIDQIFGADRQQHEPPPGARIRPRRIAGPDGLSLELLCAEPEEGSEGAPVLFVHGAFGGAWMWAERIMPYLALRGRAGYAVSLRGHGSSEGRGTIHRNRLSDYLADVRAAIGALPRPPVVVGHSLGALVVQRLIGHVKMAGVVLVSPLPPEGMGVLGPRLALTEPEIFADTLVTSLFGPQAARFETSQRALFSDATDPARVISLLPRISGESMAVLADSYLPRPTWSAVWMGLPALVISGKADRLVPPDVALRTGVYHGARCTLLEGVAHAAMIDTGWDDVARGVVDFVERKGL
jgi:pimeloyl-ACP methyl ester carboxylesterase